MTFGNIGNLDHTVLLCSRMNETRAFYSEIMKFPIEIDTPNWISFRVGSSLLSLRKRGVWAICGDGSIHAKSAAIQLAFRVSPQAVDICHAELVKKNVEILRDPTDIPEWRHRTLFFRDPENNIIEIYAEY